MRVRRHTLLFILEAWKYGTPLLKNITAEKGSISLKSHLDSRIDQIKDNNQIRTNSAERRLLTIQSLGTI
jgi:hypothetical protein